MRKTIPALLFAACLPALALAGPGGHGAGYGHNGGPGAGFGPKADSSAVCPGARGGHNFGKHNGFGPQNHMGGVNFTTEQHQKMRQIMTEQAKARYDIKQKYYNKLSDADKKAMLDELQKSRDNGAKAVRALLTPEQQKSFDERQKAQNERRSEWKEFQDWKASKTAK